MDVTIVKHYIINVSLYIRCMFFDAMNKGHSIISQ